HRSFLNSKFLAKIIVNYWYEQEKVSLFNQSTKICNSEYIIFSLIRYAILKDSILANNIEVITFSIMESVGAKIDDVSPRDPKKEPDRPLKYYIDKFIINAKPFHNVMFLVYGSCMSLLIFTFILRMFE